ncbi:hypothetical protein K443DRAFT_254452 [Laccaria amethystina LaAM-08-1]|uniref:Uncharacterized protein n=1 Tax=Laccaria amethystina LaAM-08-1 TaxID=1095629 RepID=A0A0C9XMP3_9AGAR|nr:hypothetical protein K443DRAFT_254452 [Laccaria amethystina LaAM-08-1]
MSFAPHSNLIPSLHINQLPGSEDDANRYNETGGNVALFEDGGDSIGRWDKDDVIIVHPFWTTKYFTTGLNLRNVCFFFHIESVTRFLCYRPTVPVHRPLLSLSPDISHSDSIHSLRCSPIK